MKTTGSVILLLSIGILVLVGINAMSGMTSEVAQSNDSAIVGQTAGISAVTNPVFLVLGFVVVIVGAMAAINAYR